MPPAPLSPPPKKKGPFSSRWVFFLEKGKFGPSVFYGFPPQLSRNTPRWKKNSFEKEPSLVFFFSFAKKKKLKNSPLKPAPPSAPNEKNNSSF